MAIENRLHILVEEKEKGSTKTAKEVTKETQDGTEALKNSKKAVDEQAKSFKEANKVLSNFKENTEELIASVKSYASIIKTAFNWIENLVEKQSVYIEDLNLLQVAFDDTTNEAEDYINKVAQLTGFDYSTITKSVATFRQLSEAMGITGETADTLATNMESLALDISSLYNVDITRSVNALESALTGNIKSIRSITGADITQTALQEEALALGIDEEVSAMTRAEKGMLIYLTLTEQLGNAQGDLSRTINSTENQLKIMKEQFTALARNVGGLLLPIFKELLYYLNGILMVINEIISSLLSWLGIDAETLASEFGTATSDINDYLDELDENASSTASSIKKSLRGFDKLNNISSTSGSSGSNASTLSGEVYQKLANMIKEYNSQLDTMNNKAKQIKDEILQWLGFSKDVNDQWEWSGTTLLKNIWTWWKNLNTLGKIFVDLGVALAVSTLLSKLKELGLFLANTKIGTWIYTIVGSLGEKGLKGTISSLMTQYSKLTKFVSAIAGITAVVDGIVKLSDAFKEIAKGEAQIGDYLDVLWALLEVISGIALVAGAILQNGTAITAGIVGLGIAIGGQFLTDLSTVQQETQDLANSTWNLSEANKSLLDQQNSNADYIKALYDGFSGLYDETGKLTGSYENAQAKLTELNKELGTEYQLNEDGTISIGNKKVALQDLGKEVDKYCQKLRIQATLEAYYDEYVENTKKLTKQKQEYNSIMEEIIKTQENYDLTSKDGFLQWVSDNKDKIEKLNELDSAISTNEANLSAYEKASYEASQGNYDTAMTYVEEIGKEVQKTFDETIEEIISKTPSMTEELLNELQIIDGQSANISIKMQLDTYEAQKKLSDFNKQLEKTEEYAKNYTNSSLVPSTSPSSTYGTNIKLKADGGFLDSGEIFVARENGLPEMVGSIGGKTAVANNDQIVESISIGVAKANIATEKETKVEITADANTSGLLNFITFKQKQKNRQYGM